MIIKIIIVHIYDLFYAENIRFNSAIVNEKADTNIHDLFIAEHVGIPALYADLAEADLEINKDFVLQALNISLPSAVQFNLADTEIMSQIKQTENISDYSCIQRISASRQGSFQPS